jgi:hypothetical protein
MPRRRSSVIAPLRLVCEFVRVLAEVNVMADAARPYSELDAHAAKTGDRPGLRLFLVILAEFRRAIAATQRYKELKCMGTSALACEGITRADIPRRIFEEFYSYESDCDPGSCTKRSRRMVCDAPTFSTNSGSVQGWNGFRLQSTSASPTTRSRAAASGGELRDKVNDVRLTRLDRLARSTRDLLNTLDAIGKAGDRRLSLPTSAGKPSSDQNTKSR